MIARMTTHRALEKPLKRTNPSGKTVYQARWRDKEGNLRYGWAKPYGIKGTHKLYRDAQEAIRLCHEIDDEAPAAPSTFGAYAEKWTTAHPRSKRTNRTNESRIRAVLDADLDGTPLRDWPFDQLRRRQANLLKAFLLVEQGRARSGVVNILGTLRAMAEDALDDEVINANPFAGVKVAKNDPRIQKASRKIRVWEWEQMREFARACGRAETRGAEVIAWRKVHAEVMVRTLSDLGLRIGEVLPLYVQDVDLQRGVVEVRWSESIGDVLPGTKTDHGEDAPGRDVPIPGDLLERLAAIMRVRPRALVPAGEDRSKVLREEALLFPSPRGHMWDYGDWWRDVWVPGRAVAGIDPRPHEFRHSFVSLLRAAGVDPADLAKVAGHTVETATAKYTHSVGRSFDAIREAVGA